MADWKNTLDIKDMWEKSKTGTVTVHQLAAHINEKMNAMQLVGVQEDDTETEEWANLADEFQDFSEDADADLDDFDDIMNRLYDLADTPLDSKWNGKKLCWIKTF